MKNVILIYFALITSCLYGQKEAITAKEEPKPTPEEEVDSLMAEYNKTDAPGAVIGVIQDGELIFAKGYGMANLAHSIPITPETRFNIGSTSKQFTAFALALLEQEGRLSLEDPVQRYLPELPVFEQEVTLRHLLSHTSGYRETYGMAALAGRIPGRDFLPREGALKVVQRQPELEFPPGSRFQYNSSAYVLLAEVVERVTGETFPDWIQKNVFDPLGMKNTVIERKIEQVIPGAADSYFKVDGGGYRTAFSNRVYYGTADVYTTVADMAKWLKNFRSAEVGGPAVQERMLERFVLTSGDTIDYALGLDIIDFRGLRRISHSGSHAAFVSFLTYYPELDAGVVVMRNDGLETVADKVTEIFFNKYLEPVEPEQQQELIPEDREVVLDPALVERYAGTYRAPNGYVFTWDSEGGQLFDIDPSGNRHLYIAISDTVFQVEEGIFQVSFHPRPDGSVAHATILSHPERPVLRRIEPWNPSPAELQPYTGRYYSPELETFYTVVIDDGQLVARHRWNEDVRLAPGERDKFIGEPPLSDVRFERDIDGEITAFFVSLGRTSNVRFEKQE